MSIAAVIEKVVGKQRDRQATYAADFRGIVAKIADGKEPDVDVIDQVLHDAGKSLDDLRKAVELLQKRRALRETLDRVPALQAERQEIERQLNAAYIALEEAEEKHAEVTHPLRCRLDKLMDELRDTDRAKNELDRTCTDQTVLSELKALSEEIDARRQDASRHRDAAKAARDRANLERNDAERAKSIWRGEDQVKEHLERAKEFDRQVTEPEAEALKIEKHIATLARKDAAIRERKLVP